MASPHFKGIGQAIIEVFKEGKQATFKPQQGDQKTLEVIFTSANQQVDIGGQEYGSSNPTCWFNTGLISPVYGDKIEIDGVDYTVVNVSPDGHELTQIDLDEA